MQAVDSMSIGLDETALDILRNKPLGHIEHQGLDTILGGIRQYLCIVPGGPGAGKTTFMHQIADGWAIGGHPVVIFEGELTRASMLAKSLTRLSGGELTYSDMYGGNMSLENASFSTRHSISMRPVSPSVCLSYLAK